MPTAVIACPKCSASLSTAMPFGVGTRFCCPGCGAQFAARPADVPGVRPLPPTLDAPTHSAAAWLLLAGILAMAVLLMVGAGLALAIHIFASKHKAGPVAAPLPVANAPGSPAPAVDEGPPPLAGAPDHEDNRRPARPRPLDLPGDPPPLAAADPPPQSELPHDEQQKVNAAIERGVKFLKDGQKRNGTWAEGQHAVGLAALPGLTLLECGVPADDPHVRDAAQFVRKKAANLTATYQLALAILFLDRLGDPADEPLIRSMALRLLAGQKSSGGWTYQCPLVSEKVERQLLAVLETTRPLSSLDLVAVRPGNNGIDDLFVSPSRDKAVKKAGGVIALPGPTEADKKQAREMYDGLSESLKSIPALRPPTRADDMPDRDGTDNSNTQFATLGLWAAGRHGVPMERALSLLAKRFQISQYATGGWSYHYPQGPMETPTMTGAGLLGLAVGHGVTADLKGADMEKAGEDPQVEKAMKALGAYVGKAHGQAKIRNRPLEKNYYFLWSVERVGMLYGRKVIGDNEWYPWGAEDLVEMQEDDGSWRGGSYPGGNATTDSCFALLFLKRANLAKDLSSKLLFLTQIKKP